MSVLNYAMKLESAFRHLGNGEKITADSFKLKPTEAITDSLTWLMSNGIISKEDLAIMCTEFDFGTLSLKEVLDNEHLKEKIDELLNQLDKLKAR